MMDFKSKIIQEVFENKIKSSLSNNSKVTFADGGKINDEIYSPIEFLNKFLKIVSIEEGLKFDSEISSFAPEILQRIIIALKYGLILKSKNPNEFIS
jgi:hypothetical protein